jgi:NAD(P)-dependent dehydrogenase (short-subunit alcohol dehydrogenase family)
MNDPTFDLSGRVIWVTGAGKGLGRAIALALSQAGARLAISARTAVNLDDLAAELGDKGGVVDVYPLSVTVADEVGRIVSRIVTDAGRLDGLVNCAGISPSFSRSEHLSDAVWSEVLNVNLTGTFYCARAAGRAMLRQSGGSILNVSSVHASVGFERIAAYAASKGGVEALTRTLAVEWADRGIRVNTLAPGYFDTELSRPLLDSRWSDRVIGSVPLGRTGLPEEIGGAVVFMMSDASRYMTGSTVTVDGGWTAW